MSDDNRIPAAAVGAPHRRYRVFIVAHAQGIVGPKCAVDGIWSDESLAKKRQPGRRDFETLSPGSDWNLYQPAICGAYDGVPSRVDRLRCLGNAVVPQVAEWIGRRIVDTHLGGGAI